MKFELYYGPLFIIFIHSPIPFLTSYTRSHTPNLGRNAPFLIYTISSQTHHKSFVLKSFSKLLSYLYFLFLFFIFTHSILFHSILPNRTQHKGNKLLISILIVTLVFCITRSWGSTETDSKYTQKPQKNLLMKLCDVDGWTNIANTAQGITYNTRQIKLSRKYKHQNNKLQISNQIMFCLHVHVN